MLRLLQFLAVLFLIRFVWRGLARLLRDGETGRVDGGSPDRDRVLYRGRMVQDPVCGVYVPEQTALVERRGGQVSWFCSEACRETFRRGKAQAS